MTEQLKEKLSKLPATPGVYFHKDKNGEIIYVGKAAVLKNRVRQYFQKSRGRDPKTIALVAEIIDVDWMEVESELEALFLEAEMIRRYLPRYNILLRDDKALSYIRIDYDSNYPTVTTTRRPLDDNAKYFGPYFSTAQVRQALKTLRRAFPFATKRIIGQKRASLHYHLGLDPGLEEGRTTLEEYRSNLRKLMAIIEGKRKNMAARYRNQLFAVKGFHKQVIFSDKEFLDISKDHALNELVNLLSMSVYPSRIEGYDISHMQGSDVVASMVVFTNGVSNKTEYRKFKTKINQNDDFYNMHETLYRRFSAKNVKAWKVPNLVLIDGGKGQLDAAIKARDEQGYSQIPFIGLAKREEQIVTDKERSGVTLRETELHRLGGFTSQNDHYILLTIPHTTNVIKLLQRIRDESHRFAVSYHSILKQKRQTASKLDDVSGIGPTTRKKLLNEFGSLSGVLKADETDLLKVISKKQLQNLKQLLG